MRLGVLMLPTDPWEQSLARAGELDRLGYHHLWTYDHLSWQRYRDRPWFAAIPWLTGLAATTGGIRLGTMVASPTVRHPVPLAKEAMTLDHVSGGRFTLGIGAGGTGYDATVLGASVLPPGERADRLAEFAAILDQLLSGRNGSYRGTFYTCDDARMLPGCVQQPRLPLAIAAAGRRTIRLAARYADAWIAHGDAVSRNTSPDAVEPLILTHLDRLLAECAAIGRNPAEIDRIYLLGRSAEQPLSSVDRFADFAERYATLGFTDIVFHHPRPDDPVWTQPPEIVDEIAGALLAGRGVAR